MVLKQSHEQDSNKSSSAQSEHDTYELKKKCEGNEQDEEHPKPPHSKNKQI